MSIQTLVSALDIQEEELIEKMNIQSDTIIMNQCDEYAYREFYKNDHKIQAYRQKERGVGLSRNHALFHATADIVLFSDDDLIYSEGYAEKIQKEFFDHPEADLIFFQVEVCDERRTYENRSWKKIPVFLSGRYPTFCLAIRRKRVIEQNITFSLLFGGGAPYSNGEDSLFIRECIRKGLRAYASPTTIGREQKRESTWFHGYNEKFFYDRGVLYHFLYKRFAYLMGFRFIFSKQRTMCKTINANYALKLLYQGIRDGERKRLKW